MKFADRMTRLKPSDIREVGKLIIENPGTISLAGGMPDPKVLPLREIAVVSNRILSERAGEALQYGPTIGRPSFRSEIAKYVCREKITATMQSIVVTTGSQQGIFLSGMLCLNDGDRVAVETPSYLGAFSAYNTIGIQYESIQSDNEGMDMEDLESKIIQSKGKMKAVYVIPNHQNPTGRTWTLERRKKLIEICNKHDLWIFEDNAYGDINFEGEKIQSIKSLDEEDRVLYLGTFSKVLSPGLRTGFIVSSESLTSQIEMIKYGVDMQSAELPQMIVEEYLKNYDIEKHIENICGIYKQRRDTMLQILENEFPDTVKFIRPTGGMFVWMELEKSSNTKELLRKAVPAGVAFVPGESFFVNSGVTNTMRLNYSMVDGEEIAKGMKILAKIIRNS